MSLDEIYSQEFFEQDYRSELLPEFHLVADAIYRQFRPRIVFDIGCGPGWVLSRLQRLGCSVYGFEGSSHGIGHADPTVRARIRQHDIRRMQGRLMDIAPVDLVICTEVAEHLDAEHAPTLVALLASAMCPVVFTAAPPGQSGVHHVNCQPQEYWLDLFHAHGMILDADGTRQLRSRLVGLTTCWWLERNMMVLR